MGALALKPWEFWRLTPRQFNDMVDGWRWRWNRARDNEAVWVAAIINGAGKVKHAVQPAKLLGRPVGIDFDPAKDAALRAQRERERADAERKMKANQQKKKAG